MNDDEDVFASDDEDQPAAPIATYFSPALDMSTIPTAGFALNPMAVDTIGVEVCNELVRITAYALVNIGPPAAPITAAQQVAHLALTPHMAQNLVDLIVNVAQRQQALNADTSGEAN